MGKEKAMRGLSLALAVSVIAMVLLTGCGNSGTKPETSAVVDSSLAAENSSQATSQEQPEQLQPYELIYYYGGSVQPDQQIVQDQMNKLLKEKINASIKINCVDWGQYGEKMKVMLATGDQIDLCFTSHWINIFTEQVGKGAFNSLDKLLEKYGQNIKDQIPASWWPASTINGEVYAVPNIQYAATTPGVQIRKDLYQKYETSLSNVKKIADLDEFFTKVKENEKDIVPMGFDKNTAMKDNQMLIPEGYIQVADFGAIEYNGSDKYKVLSMLELPCVKNNLSIAHKWYKDGMIQKDASTKGDMTGERKANKFAAYVAGNIGPYSDNDWKSQYGNEIVNIPFGYAIMDTTSITATMNAIPKSSKNPERAMMFLNLLFGDKEVYTTLCNGIKDTHYSLIGNNEIEVAQDSKYNPGSDWEYGNAFNGFIRKGDFPDKLLKQKEGNEAATASPLLGFNFDSSSVKSELAQMNSAKDEFYPGLFTGTLDPEKFLPLYIEKLKKAGLEKYLTELQKQVNDWKAANEK